MNPNLSRKCFAADIGATNCRFAIVDENGRILRTERMKTPQKNPVKIIKDHIRDFVDGEKLEGLAFSIAGPAVNGISFFTNLPGQPKICEDDFKKFSPNVVLLNDAAAATYCEHCKDPQKDLVFITMSSGVGGAVIKSGKLINFKHISEEIGHTPIENESKYETRCGCESEKYNHWEAFCSGTHLIEFFNKWKEVEDKPSDFNPQKPAEIFAEAKNGNKQAQKFLREAFGRVNNAAIQKVIERFTPEKIVFGGAVAINNKEELLAELKSIKNLPEVIFTKYGDDISLIGAAKYLFQTGS